MCSLSNPLLSDVDLVIERQTSGISPESNVWILPEDKRPLSASIRAGLDPEGFAAKQAERDLTNAFLRLAKTRLRSRQVITPRFNHIRWARVPIIEAETELGKFGDIMPSTTQHTDVLNLIQEGSKLMSHSAIIPVPIPVASWNRGWQKSPTVRVLIILVKAIPARAGLQKAVDGGLNSLSVTLLCIHLVQVRQIR